PSPSADRRYDLDWIRIAAFLLLFFYHVGLFYAGWDWHVKSRHATGALDAVLMVTSPWRLPLLFLVSGAASRFMLDRMEPRRFLEGRMARLLPPYVFAIFLIVPPQSYFELLGREGGAPSWQGYWRLFTDGLFASPAACIDRAAAAGHAVCIPVPTVNHMWFVGYIIAYSLILWAIARAWPGVGRLGTWLESRMTGWRVLVWPALWLAAVRLTQFPPDVTHNVLSDRYGHALYFSLFALGFLIAKSDRIAEALVRWRWHALAVWVVSYVLFTGYIWAWHGRGVPAHHNVDLLARCTMGVQQWAATAAALGFGRLYLNRDHPIRRYLTLAVFPFYIAHQTLIIAAGFFLSRQGLSAPVEASLILLLTFSGCWATYEVARRVPVLDRLYGLRPQPREASRPPAAA
ncbi:MAG TPA: acyltransferase family protein, partial [Caulobacteraceae bacterium]